MLDLFFAVYSTRHSARFLLFLFFWRLRLSCKQAKAKARASQPGRPRRSRSPSFDDGTARCGRRPEHELGPSQRRLPGAQPPVCGILCLGRPHHWTDWTRLTDGRALALLGLALPGFACFADSISGQSSTIPSLPKHATHSPNTRTRSGIEATTLRCVEAASFCCAFGGPRPSVSISSRPCGWPGIRTFFGSSQPASRATSCVRRVGGKDFQSTNERACSPSRVLAEAHRTPFRRIAHAVSTIHCRLGTLPQSCCPPVVLLAPFPLLRDLQVAAFWPCSLATPAAEEQRNGQTGCLLSQPGRLGCPFSG
jgi:hypothetical protein